MFFSNWEIFFFVRKWLIGILRLDLVLSFGGLRCMIIIIEVIIIFVVLLIYNDVLCYIFWGLVI